MKRVLTSLCLLLVSAFAHAEGCILSGVADQYTYFVAVDSTDFTTRETGLSSFTVYRSRNGAAAAAFTTPTINETSSANMPGVYELLLDEDMTLDSGDDVQHMALHITATGMAPVTKEICIQRAKITAGETVTATSGRANADAVAISGDTGAADALELHYDGTAGVVPGTGIGERGTAQAGAAGTITLRSGASSTTDYYVGASVAIVAGTGAGQSSRTISAYNGTTKVATVSEDWVTNPASDSVYEIWQTAPSTPGISTSDIRGIVIEDQGGGVTLGCTLAVLLAYAAGDLATTGGDSTYEDPSGTETRITGTVASAGNRTASVTCPSY